MITETLPALHLISVRLLVSATKRLLLLLWRRPRKVIDGSLTLVLLLRRPKTRSLSRHSVALRGEIPVLMAWGDRTHFPSRPVGRRRILISTVRRVRLLISGGKLALRGWHALRRGPLVRLLLLGWRKPRVVHALLLWRRTVKMCFARGVMIVLPRLKLVLLRLHLHRRPNHLFTGALVLKLRLLRVELVSRVPSLRRREMRRRGTLGSELGLHGREILLLVLLLLRRRRYK